MVSTVTLNASRKKQEKRDSEVREMEERLGKLEDHPDDATYIHTSPAEIVANLKSRKDGWSVERVMIAFIRSACAAHRKTNCLTEIMFREALKDAKLKDRELAISGEVDGAFWGLPSSFKDTYNICGVDSSLGLSQFCDDPTTDMEAEAGIVKVFRKAGGIPFCKTNVPQLLFAIECSNPIFGTTTNPYDAARTSGGSSGGEAVMVALHGTPLGWGSDVGGSLRVPAHYTGCCALKPMRGRWPHSGQRSCVNGADGVKMQGSFNGESLMPIPWEEVELPERLKIGYFVEFPGIKTSPACARAVNETVKKLEAAGHEIVPFSPPRLVDAFKSFVGMTSADGYQALLGNLGPDPMEPSLRLVTLGSSMPRLVHWLVVQLLFRVLRDTLFGSIFAVSKPKPVSGLYGATDLRNQCSAAFTQAAWDKEKFDAVICPVITVPALEHGRTTFLAPVAVGTIIFNIIDSTVGTLPVTRVDGELDCLPADFLKDSQGSWLLEKRVYSGTDPAYDAKKMHGLPVGIQVVGKPWEDEEVLGVMKVVESAVEFK